MGIFHLFLMLTTLLEALPQSDASDLTKIAQSVPTEDNYYIYDIIGELSSADIINGFGDLNQVYRFKVLGGRRFIILVKVVDENGAKYFDLKLPRASTIMAYAVERNGQYAEYFGVNGTLDQELIPFPDKGLNLAEFTVVEKGVDLDTLKKNMKNAEREGKGFINKDKFHVRSFHVTGTFPIKFIVFMTAPTYVLDRLALEWAKNFGDPSQSHEFFVTVSVTNLVLLLTELSTDAHAVIPLELILLASPRTHSILWIDLETLTSITIPVQFIDEPMAIDYDPVDNRVYWIDKERQEIWSAFLNGTDTRLLRGWGLNTVLEDIALDATSRLLFFSDSGQGLIGLLSISAFDPNQLSLLNASKPRQLALDPGNGVIFWIDLNINVKINRVNYDGNDNRAIVINDLVHPTAITLDIENGYLYWVDPGKNTVEFTNMEGQHRSTFKSPYQSHFVALAFLANQLYFVDIYNSAITNTTAVWRVVNANGTLVFTTPILHVLGDVTDIVIYSAREKQTGSMSVSKSGFYSALIGGLVGCCLGIIIVITAVYVIVHMKRKGRTPSHNIQFRKASNLVFNPSAMTAAERNTISYISFHRDSEFLPELQGTVLQPPLSASSDNGNLNLGNHTFRKSRGVSRTEPVSVTRVNGGDVREDTTGNVNDSSQTDTAVEEADVRTEHVKHPIFYCRL